MAMPTGTWAYLQVLYMLLCFQNLYKFVQSSGGGGRHLLSMAGGGGVQASGSGQRPSLTALVQSSLGVRQSRGPRRSRGAQGLVLMQAGVYCFMDPQHQGSLEAAPYPYGPQMEMLGLDFSRGASLGPTWEWWGGKEADCDLSPRLWPGPGSPEPALSPTWPAGVRGMGPNAHPGPVTKC